MRTFDIYLRSGQTMRIDTEEVVWERYQDGTIKKFTWKGNAETNILLELDVTQIVAIVQVKG